MINKLKGQLSQSNIVFSCDFVSVSLTLVWVQKNGQSRRTEHALVCCLLFDSPVALSALMVAGRCRLVI